MKRKSNKSKNLLDSLLQDPSSLIHKRVKHKIQETKEDIAEWYDATVVTIDQNNLENPIQTKYDMTYDIDGPTKICTFPLLSYLKKGYLIIMN